MKYTIAIRSAVFFCFAAIVANCPVYGQRGTPALRPIVTSNAERKYVGDVYVSFIGIRPLTEVIDELQPQFDITAQSALQAAVPNTLASSESALSSIKAALQVGLTFSGGSVPTNSPMPGNAATLSGMTNFLGVSLDMDPVSKYQAAASLFQEIKLLNRSLKDIPHYTNHVAYIVTAQITLVPYQRNAPYDAYADLAFFTDINEPPTPPHTNTENIPIVFPTLNSDQLESANDQQSVNRLREIGLALAAAFHGVGVQGSFDQLNQDIDALNGNSLNSLLTIGKVSQNCIAVRLGARNQPGSSQKLGIVPEHHNIALLVLAKEGQRELQMISHTTFRGADGKELQGRTSTLESPENFATNILKSPRLFNAKQVRELIREEKSANYIGVCKLRDALVNDVFDGLETNIDVLKNDISNYLKDKCNFDPPFFKRNRPDLKAGSFSDNPDVVDWNTLWLEITRMGVDDYSSDLVRFPSWQPILPATNQTVLYAEDKQSVTFTLNGGQRLAASRMFAELTFTNDTQTNVLLSDQIDIVTDGTSANVHFPPFSSIGTGDTNKFRPKQLELHFGLTNDLDCNFATNKGYTHFASLKKSQSDDGSSPWKISRAYGYLTAGIPTNEFRIVLALSTNSPTYTNHWYIDVQGPLIITNVSKGRILEDRTNGVYLLNFTNALKPANDYEVVFTFGSLPVGQAVDFNLLNDKFAFVSTLNHQLVYPPSAAQPGTQAKAGGP